MFAKASFGFLLAAACVLVLVPPGLAQIPEPAQCLVSGTYNLAQVPQRKDDKTCYEECVLEPECHMAVVTNPLSDPSECLLVNCLNRGQIYYARDPSSRISVYPKSTIDDEQKNNLENGAFALIEERVQCFRPMPYAGCSTGAPKFFYDTSSFTCKRFLSGCGTSRNTFDSQESCEALCTEKYRCYRPMDQGQGRPGASADPATEEHNFFFYNINSLRCESFHFRGSGSNGNIFRSVDECQGLCAGVKVAEDPEGLVCPSARG